MSDSCGSRRRGRPPGTGKDDSRALKQIALLLYGKSDGSSWGAINQVAKSNQEPTVELSSTVRRLDRKWRAQGKHWLAEVRAEKMREREAQFLSGVQNGLLGFALLGERLRPMFVAMHEKIRLLDEQIGPSLLRVHESLKQIKIPPEYGEMLRAMSSIKIAPEMAESAARLSQIRIDPQVVALLKRAGGNRE